MVGHSAEPGKNGAEPGKNGAKPGKPWWKRWWARVTATVSFVAAVLAIVGFATGYLPHHGSDINFTDPVPDVTSQKPCVFNTSGRGVPPSGQALVLSDQMQGAGPGVDPWLHLVLATIKGGTDQWSAVMVIGNTATKPGTAFTLTAWSVNAEWINYLTAQEYPTKDWWASGKPPPEAKNVATATVARIGGAVSDCPRPPKRH
jgi:hypothetical protein